MILRAARDEDLPAIHAVQCESYPPSHHETIEVYSSIIKHGISHVVAADENGPVIGYCLVQYLPHPSEPPPLNEAATDLSITASREHVFIHDCAVSPAHRSRGIASKLVNEVIEQFRASTTASSLTLIALEGAGEYWLSKGFFPMATSIKRMSMRREMTAPLPLRQDSAPSPHTHLSSLSAGTFHLSISSQTSLDSYGLNSLHLEFVDSIDPDHPLTNQCLDTIASSFAGDKTAGSDFYAGADPERQTRFWRLLAEECLSSGSIEKPLLVLRRGEAAALCQLWTPPTALWDVKDATYWDLLTPEGQDCFARCHNADGEWFNACLSLHQRHGPFYSLEFLACLECSRGQGLASTLLSALTMRADKEQRHMFLVAMSERLMRWYSTKFGFVLTKESIFTRSDNNTMLAATLFYMERPPMGSNHQALL